jgi:hypothetical protein
LKLIPICNTCYTFYSFIGCPTCENVGKTRLNSDTSPKINEITKKLFPNIPEIEKKVFATLNPPPIPSNYELMTTQASKRIQLNIKKNQTRCEDIKKTTIFRRGIMLVFDQESYELLLQLPWIKKILVNELEIRFEKEFSNEHGKKHAIETLFRIKVIFANQYELTDFLKEKNIQEEMALKLNNAFIIIYDKLLSNDWIQFLNPRERSNSQHSLLKHICYISRTPTEIKHYEAYCHLDAENLFLSLIKKLLVLRDESNLQIVSNKKSMTYILDPVIERISSMEYSRQNLLITGETINCMGHGGQTEEFSTCQICGGALCVLCEESFLICPGSISYELHKFIKK